MHDRLVWMLHSLKIVASNPNAGKFSGDEATELGVRIDGSSRIFVLEARIADNLAPTRCFLPKQETVLYPWAYSGRA